MRKIPDKKESWRNRAYIGTDFGALLGEHSLDRVVEILTANFSPFVIRDWLDSAGYLPILSHEETVAGTTYILTFVPEELRIVVLDLNQAFQQLQSILKRGGNHGDMAAAVEAQSLSLMRYTSFTRHTVEWTLINIER